MWIVVTCDPPPTHTHTHAERVAREIGAMEQTIKEQDDTNEKLRASAALHREEADIMQQIIRVRDKEVGASKRSRAVVPPLLLPAPHVLRTPIGGRDAQA